MRPHRTSSFEQGATVLELTIAVFVILILAGLVLPLFSRVRQTGLTTRCISNLRQIYQATLTFTEDHDGLLPPPLGPVTEVDSRYFYNNYWWQQPYLAPYIIGPRNRRKDSRGQLRQEEVEIYNCPARHPDGPDSWYARSNGNPGISYVMPQIPKRRSNHLLHLIPNKSKKIYLTEGRYDNLSASTCKTGEMGSRNSSRRLRRFHGKALNILFYDGHIELRSDSDEEIKEML